MDDFSRDFVDEEVVDVVEGPMVMTVLKHESVSCLVLAEDRFFASSNGSSTSTPPLKRDSSVDRKWVTVFRRHFRFSFLDDFESRGSERQPS